MTDTNFATNNTKEAEIRPTETVDKNDVSSVDFNKYMQFRRASEAEFDNSRLEYYNPAKDEKSIYNSIQGAAGFTLGIAAIGANILPFLAPVIQASAITAAIASSCTPAFQTANYVVGKVPFLVKTKLLEETGIRQQGQPIRNFFLGAFRATVVAPCAGVFHAGKKVHSKESKL